MADAAAPAVRARALPRDLGPIGVGVAAAVGLGALAAAEGGYFPPSWGWTALVGLWIAAAWLLLDRVEVGGGALAVAFLTALATFAGWTWLSLLWTENTVHTTLEGFRVIAYLGAAAAMLFVVRRGTTAAFVRGVLAAIVLISTFALATRLFPDRLGTYDPIATYRLSEPLGYWNGLGAFAAMGALLALGIAARDRMLIARFLAGAAFPILVSTMFFTFSRGAWFALALGFLVAFALDPRRLQFVVVAIAVALPAALAVWAASTSDALTERDSPLFAAADQGGVFALILLGCSAVAAASAAALAFAEEHIHPSRPVRVAFASLLAVLAISGSGTVLVHFGGPVALVEKAYDAFRGPTPDPQELERRLFSFSGNGRADLWATAWDQYRANTIAGSGAGTFEQYWNRHRPEAQLVRDAHSLYVETLAELGTVGTVLLLLALGAPVVAAFAARREPLAVAPIGAYAAYLVHAGADWDWELTALSLAGIACCVALLALRPSRAGPLVPGPALRLGGAAVAIALTVVAFVGLVGSSASAASQRALERTPPDFAEAKDEARKARRWAPWSSEPWQRLGEAQLTAGELAAARASFRRAISKEPTDWELWFRLAEASTGRDRRRALAQATRLNPLSPELRAFREESG